MDGSATEITGSFSSVGLHTVKETTHGTHRWLWLRADPPYSPEHDHDLVAAFSADEGWFLSTPGGRTARLASAQELPGVIADLYGEEQIPPGEAVRGIPDWAMAVAGGAVTGVVVPFVQAMIGKTGEDAYQALRDLFARPRRKQEAVVDPAEDVHLIVPDPVPAEALRQLVDMPRAELRGRVLVWSTESGRWMSYERRS